MRFAGAGLVAMLLLGSVALCQYAMTRVVQVRLARAAEEHAAREEAPGDVQPYRLVVLPGFDARHDPFAVTLSEEEEPARLAVRVDGETVLMHRGDLLRGDAVEIAELHLSGEEAAVFVEASPSGDDALVPCALRLQIFRGGALCDEHTLWSAGGGQRVAGEVTMSLRPRLASLDRGLGDRDGGEEP